jgi:hypothetical protein
MSRRSFLEASAAKAAGPAGAASAADAQGSGRRWIRHCHLAAGRIPDRGTEQAFRTAFENIKPTDGICLGMFARVRDEVQRNAGIVRPHSGP